MLEKASAYSAVIGAAAGTLGTLSVAIFFLGGQWERWKEIREAHLANNLVNQPVALPSFADFARKDEIPSVAGLAKKSDIPDVSGFLPTSTFIAFAENLGRGATTHPRQFPITSNLCPEGSAMVGVEYVVASGDNAGALYHGLAPVCRRLSR